ncbi:Hypothetical predicted protein [Cloeon dipterum]|uniref:F-box domain-containing protein n=1 Tax=Cloeon dipterum TaxID=197152 RepID=A0A8S1CFI4_9INSE|nr:Hypothetical predicted protein [Cloeon dipterum]
MLFCQAPNLETLVINEAIFGYENFLLDLRICNTIAILSNLKKLHLNYQIISYADLKALCKQLKKLEYVDVNVDLYTQFNDQDEAEIEDSKICFSNLRVFIFDDNFPRRNSIDILERFAQFCFEHLPKLEVIQNFADNYSIQDFELDGNASLRVSSERPALRHLSTVPTDVQNLHLIYPNVTHLKLENGMIKYTKLRKLCKKLKHLEHLTVNISFDCNLDKFSKADFVKFKASFSRLRVFVFRETEFKIKRADETSGRLINLFTHFCLVKLPNLEIVHNYADSYAPHELELGRPTFRLNEKRLALQHLCTVPAHEEFHVNFPNVVYLKVIFELKKCYSNCEIDALLRFTKINSLTLMNVDCGYAVNKILDAYGQNLRVLKIGNPKCQRLSLKFNRVFSRCPALETLLLDNVDMIDSSEEINSFDNLIDFEWNIPKEKRLVHLSNILSAPKLKRVSLSCKIYQNSKDLQQLSNLIKEQKILQQLESFKMTRTMFINLDEAHDSAFNEMSVLIKNASAFLPKLKDLNPQFYFYSTKNWPLIMRSFEIDSFEDSSMDLSEKRAAAAFNWLGDPDLIKFLQVYSKD